VIGDHPVTGVGLGAEVSFYSPMYNPTTGLMGLQYVSAYVHNSYLFLLFKLGLVGTVPFLALLAITSWRAVGLVRHGAPPVRGVGLASISSIVMLLLLGLTGPHLTSTEAVPLLAGVVAAVDLCRASGAHDQFSRSPRTQAVDAR
jgi:O-antigen ligase